MKYCFGSILLLLAAQLNAQNIRRLQHITVEDGLSQNSVNYILQDAHGFMWFATGDGLNRYDGKSFVAYKSRLQDKAAGQMNDRNINSCIIEDKENRIWMTTDMGLSFINTRKGGFENVINTVETKNDAHLMAIDNDNVWAAVFRRGIIQINIVTLQKKSYPYTDSLQARSPRVYPVFNGVVTASGLWMADGAGLLFFDKHTHKDERMFVSNEITGVYQLHDGRLLMTATGGIYIYDIEKRNPAFVPIQNEAAKKPVIWESFVEDTATHMVYLGSSNDGSIGKFDLVSHTYELIKFQNNPTNCLYLDHSRNLWIGTEGNGLYKLDTKPSKFHCYTPDLSQINKQGSSLMVKSIYRDDSGKIWIGTYNNGLLIYDSGKSTCRILPLPVSTEVALVCGLFIDSAGSLVLGIGNHILWLDPLKGTVKKQVSLPIKLEYSPEDPVIFSLVEWKKGHYLAGTNLSLFSLNCEGRETVITRPRILETNGELIAYVYNLHPEKDGIINVGKRNGFVKIKMLNDTSLQVMDKGFYQTVIRHFYKSSGGPILWIASEMGLIAYNESTKKYIIFDESAGLANSCVYAILPRNDSILWVSTNKGLSEVKVHYAEKITADFANYSSKDGLQSNEFNTGAYYKHHDGTLYFGGISGVNWFDPVQVLPNKHNALPALAAIYVNDSLFAGDTAVYTNLLDLPYERNTISFTLRALEFTEPGQNRFAYMLEGLDKEWVYTTNDRVRYSNLRPGEYTFRFKVSNNDGLWNDAPMSLQIVIRPPFWETWPFRLLLVMAAIGITLLGIRLYVRRKVKMRTRELENQQLLYQERLRISKDVHDDLGSGLSKISLMAELARKKISTDIMLVEDIQQISATSKELVDNMHDLIWVLNPENTTLEQLVARLREYCADYLEHIPIKASLVFPDKVPQMRILRAAQRNIFLTTKEAINNSIKHARASNITISVSVENDTLSVYVQDNGKGFDVAGLKGHGSGLRNMRQRIEMIGGRFAVESAMNKTIVSIEVPFAKLQANENTTFM